MNYENYINESYAEKIGEASKLLNEAKDLLKAENIDSLLNAKFALLSMELRELIINNNELKTSELKEHIIYYNHDELQKSYAKNKEDLINSLALQIDFNALFVANKNEFINITKAEFSKELQRLLNENESLENAINLLKERVENTTQNANIALNERLESLELERLTKELLRAEITRLSNEALRENATFISKESAKELLANEDFLANLVSDILNHSVLASKIKYELAKVLESINKQALERALNHKELKKMMILQNMIIASLSLQNELKIISENMAFINDYKLIEKRKEFLENLDKENAKLLFENKFKAV
ncbi:hypothetical protein CVU5213_07405 [Campylobacter vulpis]|uniref:Uncharacterized protein n=1 Tax=Campylobacter vulpis TaxID=1655500 RepID=A0ABS5P4D8_9BACT|nr:hypothetical protein [Campylobacter vulpis]MBS4235994.1 hypothetical protein [Campylobacter vulpis]MBS4241539.1 hypothetical protein [Campylobacter vulpis]MBS4269463.1 hypothetical protein [Campylobacter vulpis]